jgi:hypothetical protein
MKIRYFYLYIVIFGVTLFTTMHYKHKSAAMAEVLIGSIVGVIWGFSCMNDPDAIW